MKIPLTQGKRNYLGCYKNEKEAAQAYNKAATKQFGKFACINVFSKWVDV